MFKNLIKSLFIFVAKIVAAVIADELVKWSSDEAQPKRTKANTNHFGSEEPDLSGKKEFYHDVLMVAFDISGLEMHLVQEWLLNNMPAAGQHEASDGSLINVDAWWIADDVAGDSDCDSAVFVSRGDQESARRLLRINGLVH